MILGGSSAEMRIFWVSDAEMARHNRTVPTSLRFQTKDDL